MLARLDAIPGVGDARADWTGRHFLVELDPGRDEKRVEADVTAALGEGARRLTGGAAEAQVESFRRGEPWVRAGETMRLSREEARVVAARLGGEAARAAKLDDARARRLTGLIERELAAAFERHHASGGGAGRTLGLAWDEAMERVIEQAKPFMTEDEIRRARASVEAE